MANSICAVTEASDKFFHLTRVSVYSFIEHNRWFDGILKLLVHQDLPLSERNLLLLKLIYPTIEIISINSQTTNRIKKLAAFRNSNKYIDLLFDTLKIFIFTIPATKILYFSNKCLFLNTVVDILISGKIVSDENFSLAYIDGETNPIQLDMANIPPFEEIISSINSLNYTILPALSSYSANYPNAKFNNIVQSRLKNFPSIVFNTFTSESARYSKINQVWLHKNHEISNTLHRPSAYNSKTIEKVSPIKQSNISLNQSNKIKSITQNNYTNSLNLIHISTLSKYLEGKKIAIVANSAELLNYNYGELIDSHDIVIRFNGYVDSAPHTGRKTNIHCIFREAQFNLEKDSDYLIVFSKPVAPWRKSIFEIQKKYPSKKIINYNFPNIKTILDSIKYDIIPTSGLALILLIKELNLSSYKLTLFGFNGYVNRENSILRSNDSLEIAPAHNYKSEKFYISQTFEKILPEVFQKKINTK